MGRRENIIEVKTKSSGPIFAKLISAYELLIYKVLEHLGVGCETHFMHRITEDVYIATLDAGYNGTLDVVGTDALGEAVDEACGQTLWGVLQNINLNASPNDWDAIEADAQDNAEFYVTNILLV